VRHAHVYHDDVARHHDATPAQISLAWLMSRPGVTALGADSERDESRSAYAR